MKKRLLAAVMSLCMIVSLLPVSALAAGNNQTGAVPGAAEQVPKVSATDETGHVNISKAVSEDGKTLTLEAYVTDEAETVVTSAPMDIVLVLDTSGSMKNPISGFKGPSKMSALQTAVKSFIQQVAEAMPETATEENVQRISIVTFASNASMRCSLTAVNEAGVASLNRIVGGLTGSGATRADLGLDKAKDILSDTGRNAGKVVILFTDGEPTSGNSFENEVAADAINTAHAMKQDGVTIFTVGVFNNKPNDDNKVGQYMRAVSSNYPDATAEGSNGGIFGIGAKFEVDFDSQASDKYYMTASSAEDLKDIFNKIPSLIPTSEVNAGANTKLTDTMSAMFTFADSVSDNGNGTVDGVTVYTVPCTGKNENGYIFNEDQHNSVPGVKVSLNEEKGIEVTGFDYSANAATETTLASGQTQYSGCKLVITIPIKPDTSYTQWDADQQYYATNASATLTGYTVGKEHPQPGTTTLSNSPTAPVTVYTVTYNWTGNVPDGVTLPTDEGTYVKGQSYTVDSRYTNGYTVNVEDAYGNVTGIYTFSGWTDRNNGIMGDEDVVITSSWSYENKETSTHSVKYDWGTNVPEGVTLPTDNGTYVKGQSYTVDGQYTAGYTVDVKDAYGNVTGIYTFSGWTDRNNGIMGDEDVVITSSWSYENKETSTHSVKYDWGTNVPEGVTLPTDNGTYVKGQSYTVDSQYKTGYTVDVEDAYGNVTGIYTFSGWTDPNNGVMGDEDVVIIGSWNYTPSTAPQLPQELSEFITGVRISCINQEANHTVASMTYALQKGRYEIVGPSLGDEGLNAYYAIVTVDATEYVNSFSTGSGKDHTLQEVAQKTVILVYQDGKWSVKSGVSSDGFVEFKVTCENPADLADTPTKRIVTAPEVILKDDTKLTQGINYVKATEENGELIAYVSDDTANILFEVKISVDGAMAITVEDLAEDAQFAGIGANTVDGTTFDSQTGTLTFTQKGTAVLYFNRHITLTDQDVNGKWVSNTIAVNDKEYASDYVTIYKVITTPSVPDLGLLEGQITVDCMNGDYDHPTKQYGVWTNSYVDSGEKDGVQLGMAQTNGEWTYTLMLNGGAYASKYDEDNGFKSGTHAAMNDVLVELTWDGIKWNVPAGIYVHVVCKNPEAPTTEELTNLFDGKVTIDCVNFAVEHEDMICGLLPDGYMLGSMEKIGDQWHVNLTLKIGVYANYFDDQRGYAPGTHHMYDSNDVIVTLVWNDETDSWELFSDAVTVRVNCKTPEAPGEDQIPGILEGKPVLIKCINENRKHDLVDQTYGLMDGSYKVMGVNEVDGTWTCTVEINVEQYLKAFIEKTGSIIHVESGAATQQVILTWDTERNTWLAPVDDVYAATFEATCDPDMTSGTYELTGFSKELVTDPSEFPMDSITYPVDGVVTIPYDGTVTLLYKLTVTGDPGAQYTIKDEEAQFAGGDYSLTGTIPSEGFIEVFVTKTFSADDINADGKLVNTALVEPGDRTEGPDDGSDTEEVEAKKEVETYTIVYHGNGGYVTSNPDKDQTTSTANVGEKITLKNADTFTRDGYVFQGWALTAEGEVVYQGSQKVTFDAQAGDKVNLYAVWAEEPTEEQVITVRFDNQDGTWADGEDGYESQYTMFSTTPDATNTAPAVAAPEDKVFAYWIDQMGNRTMEDGEAFSYSSIAEEFGLTAGDVLLLAVYVDASAEEQVITVRFDNQDGTWADGEDGYESQYTMFSTTPDATNTAPAVAAPEDKVFAYWIDQMGNRTMEDGEAFSYSSIAEGFGLTAGDVLLGAVYEDASAEPEETYNVYFVIPNEQGGSFDPHNEGDTARYTTTAEVKELTDGVTYTVNFPKVEVNSGYELTGWRIVGTETVTWDPEAWMLEGVENYAVGNDLTIEAIIEKVGGEEPSNSYTVAFYAGSHGSLSGTTRFEIDAGSSMVESGYSVPNVNANNYYSFNGWLGSDGSTFSSNQVRNLTINSNITFTAQYKYTGGGGGSETETYAVYYHSNYGSDERKTGGRYEENDEVEVRDNDWWDRDNYRFLGWNTEEDGSGRDYDPEDTFDMPDEDVHLYAQWRRTASDPSDSGTDRWLETQDHRLYMVGYPDDTFGPDRNMTRAEVAQMFYALLLDQNVSYTENFSDVPSDAWYAEAVNTLAALGMIDGYPDCTFRPDATITRAEFCVIALAFAYEPESFDCSFYDVSVNDWFYDYVAQATSYGWISGGSGAFRPNDAITRAEVSVIVNNMLGRVADEDYVDRHEDELTTFPDVTSSYWAYYSIMETTNSHDYTKSNGTENWR